MEAGGAAGGVAALAAAHAGDLTGAAALNERSGAIALSPTLTAMRSYIAGEIEALAGRAEQAAAPYEQAIGLADPPGVTFAHGFSSVGLLQRCGS